MKMFKFQNSNINNQHGFTMIEMLIAVVLSVLVISGVYEVFNSQQKAYSVQDQVAEMQQNARVAMDMMAREIRMAGYDPRKKGWTPFASATATSIQFYADLNANGDNPPADTDEDITFALNGAAQITRNGQPIVENISNLTFSYTYADGEVSDNDPPGLPNNAVDDTTDDLDDIRVITISVMSITARVDSGYTHPTEGDGFRRRTLRASVRPRNLGM